MQSDEARRKLDITQIHIGNKCEAARGINQCEKNDENGEQRERMTDSCIWATETKIWKTNRNQQMEENEMKRR